jgi:hypothetical protein
MKRSLSYLALILLLGTLGGSLAGEPSGTSDLVRLAGWEAHTTFYLHNAILGLVILTAAVLLGIGTWRYKRHA